MNPGITMASVYARLMPVTESGCWLWTGSVNTHGYPQVGWHGKQELAHRLIWSQNRGDIPRGLFVLHKCDVRCCCNPDHLFLGTHTDNMKDAARKGRQKNSRKTHCPRGHLYDAVVRLSSGRSYRYCRECKRHSQAAS